MRRQKNNPCRRNAFISVVLLPIVTVRLFREDDLTSAIENPGSRLIVRHNMQGVGLITLHEKHPRDYDYELIQMYRLALDKDSKIPEADGHPKSYYQQIAFLDAVPQLFFKICLFFNKIGAKISSVIGK